MANFFFTHIYIFDNGGRLKTKLYDKRVDFTFSIVNFPFISSNMPVSPTYGVYISQLIRYSNDCAKYSDFMGNCWCKIYLNKVATSLKSSLQKFYGRHHNLVDRYKISISQMIMDLLLFT